MVVPGHGDPPEQRDGRAGPQPARLPPPSRRTADAEHDGPHGRDARRGGRAGAGQRRLQPHPLGAAADDRRRRRPRPRRARGGARLRVCTSRTARSTPSRGSTSRTPSRRAAGRGVSRAQPVLRRRPGGAAPARRDRAAPATPGAGGGGAGREGSAEAHLAVGACAGLGAVDQLRALDRGAEQTREQAQAGVLGAQLDQLLLGVRAELARWRPSGRRFSASSSSSSSCWSVACSTSSAYSSRVA